MIQLKAVKMTYAQSRDGPIVSIANVHTGLECDCICIGCHGRLSAVNQWHFSHHQEIDEANCQWTGECELHFKVKEYLEKHKQITVPIGFSNPSLFAIKFDEVLLEKSLRSIKRIPDITCYSSGERIIVEIKVTREVDKKKIADYKKVNASVIEFDFSDVVLFSDVVSEVDIENYLKMHNGNWLSVAPVGEVAELFQAHERSITKSLIQENKELEVTRISLINELDGIKTYINAYRNEYDDCQRQIQHVREVLESTQQQTKMAKARYVEMVAAAKSAFNSTVHQLEQDALTEYAIQNIVTLDRLREETIDQINNEHRYRRDEIGAFEVALQAKKIELSHIELVIENNLAKEVYLGELENHLESQLNNFKQKELEWKKAALANSSIKRHFSRLEPDLRDMCRKGGIPWPFNSSLLSELSPSEGSKQ